MRRLRDKALELAPLSQALEDLMTRRVHTVAKQRSLGMWTFLATLMRWPDVTLVASMVSGFDIVGLLAKSNRGRMRLTTEVRNGSCNS